MTDDGRLSHYAPPVTDDAPPTGAREEDIDRLLATTQRNGMVKAATGLAAATGAVLVLSALQLWGVGARLRGVLFLVPFLLAGFGVAGVYLSLKLYRQRSWAALAVAVLHGLAVVGTATWFLVALFSGFFTVAMLIAPLLAVLSAVFAAIAIGPCRQTEAARAQLRELGYDVDF